MYTPRVRYAPKLTKYIASTGVLEKSPVCLVDVGASGGIDNYWEVFGSSLRAFGFDPLVKEVERLNNQQRDKRIRYFPFFVGYNKYDELFPPEQRARTPNNDVFRRTSAARAQELKRSDYAREHFDQTGSGVYATDMIELDEFFLNRFPEDIDFIKIDTDGSDYQVLLGAKRILEQTSVLGIAVESQFHGLLHEHANTFSNIDRLLRSNGFSLFDLEVYRYSRAVLPKKFVYRIPAQTFDGQVVWADALYFRDLGTPEYEATWRVNLDNGKLLKQLCLLELFGLEDCAAEVLVNYGSRLKPDVDVESCLDLLTPQLGKRVSYRAYNQQFENNLESFFSASA